MVKAIFFDVFGTVVDWRKGLALGFERAFAKGGQGIDPHALAGRWYERYRGHAQDSAQGEALAGGGDRAARATLDALLASEQLDRSVGERELAQLATSWQRLPPWPDSVPGLRALRREYVVASCTDCPTSTMTWLAKHAGLPWDLVLGADLVGAGKPESLFVNAAAAIGLEPPDVMYASSHNAELAMARRAGLKTAFFARPKEFGPGQTTDLAPEEAWEVVAFDLLDLARHMESAIY